MGSSLRFRPQPFTPLAVCAAAGIIFADWWPVGLAVLLPIFGISAGIAHWHCRTTAFLIAVAAGFALLHTLRHHEGPANRLARRLSTQPQVVTATGIVRNEPHAFKNGRGHDFSRFLMRLESLTLNHERIGRGALVSVSWIGKPPKYGDRVKIVGEARNLGKSRNPGEFNFTKHQQRSGVFSEIRVRFGNDHEILSSGQANPFIAAALSAREWMQEALSCGLGGSPEVTGLIRSMVLGMKGEISSENRNRFRQTGTLHVLVVSGLHVGMLAFVLWQSFTFFGLNRRITALLVVPFLVFYSLVTGFGPGSVRATIMASVVLLGIAVDRPAVTFNSFSAALFLTLLWDTNQLFMPGFQFSFTAVFSILVVGLYLEKRFSRLGYPDPFLPRRLWSPAQTLRARILRYTIGLACVSFAAWVGSLLFTVGYFHQLSLTALFANVMVVPFAFIILSQGVLSILSYGLSSWLAAHFNNCNWLAAKVLLSMVQVFATLPGGSTHVELPNGKAPAVAVMVLDLGAGAGIHIRADDEDWMIDCGNAHDYRSVIEPYLRTRGVDHLDGLVLTHGDSAHVGGALELACRFVPQMIVDSAVPARSPAMKKFRSVYHRTIVQRGDSWNIGKRGEIRVLYPPPDIDRRYADDESLVMMLHAVGWRILLLNDSGFLTEQWLIENEPDLRADFIIVGRTRTDISLTPGFLRAVEARGLVLGREHFADRPRDEFKIRRRTPILQAQRDAGAVTMDFWANRAIVRSRLNDSVITIWRN